MPLSLISPFKSGKIFELNEIGVLGFAVDLLKMIGVKKETLINLQRQTINSRHPDKARNEGCTGIDDMPPPSLRERYAPPSSGAQYVAQSVPCAVLTPVVWQ
jgi:hypothetical protein